MTLRTYSTDDRALSTHLTNSLFSWPKACSFVTALMPCRSPLEAMQSPSSPVSPNAFLPRAARYEPSIAHPFSSLCNTFVFLDYVLLSHIILSSFCLVMRSYHCDSWSLCSIPPSSIQSSVQHHVHAAAHILLPHRQAWSDSFTTCWQCAIYTVLHTVCYL